MAMYTTKMSASGTSSLILTPKTISRDLEKKISSAINAIVTKHDMAKLTTRIVRQLVEKEINVSLNNHKDVLKRLMHHELRRIKAQKVAQRVIPEPWRMKERRERMRKAMHFVFQQLQDANTFDQLGIHAMQHLYALQSVETKDTLRWAAFYARQCGAIWLKEERHTDWQQDSLPSLQQVIDCLVSVLAVERIGISHSRRTDLFTFFERSPPLYGVTEYLGWNPSVSPPRSDDPTVSEFSRMAHALLICYHARALGVSIGCTFPQLVQFLPSFYPYKGPNELTTSEYRQQFHLITTLVMVLTNFGTLLCDPELLPHEYLFLRQHLVYHIARQDVPLVAESLKALKCFSGADNLVQVKRAMAFLLATQQEDGSWRQSPDQTTEQVYYATINALFGICDPHPHGFAPSIPEVAPLLEVQMNADLSNSVIDPPPATTAPTGKSPRTSDGSVVSYTGAVAEKQGKRPPVPAVAVSSVSGGSTVSSNRDPTRVTRASAANSASTTTSSVKTQMTTRSIGATEAPASDPSAAGASASSGSVSQEDLETQVRFFHNMLEQNAPNGDVKQVTGTLALNVLQNLSNLSLTVDILKVTGIGRVINKLRKHSVEQVSSEAQALVAKWKKMVKE